ncbi:butyrophilin subfamily 3 member A2-like [Excalfactoria chinensis]|uniref:butyrophilin subfamily 3 member A2-like n=1 Tax=Excalfactoria chinensis TaxID=46218 RepID=UPI003B3BBDC1
MASRFQHAMILHVILFLQIVHLVKGQFRMIPRYDPVLGVVGKGVILPCQLEAQTIPKGIIVQWTFIKNSQSIEVTTYDGNNAQNPVWDTRPYFGRTSFFQSEVNKGNLSLHLKNVMVSDKGKYICSVSLENWNDGVVVDLDVAARGDKSEVFLDGHVGQGIGLNCKSQGWFPEPEVYWLDSKGRILVDKGITQNLQTSSGLFDVVSSLTIEPGSDVEVSCRIINDLLNTVCESRVLISDVFFPSTSPWMTAFLVITFCTLAAIAALGYKLKIDCTRRQKEETVMDELKKEKENLEKDIDSEEKMNIAELCKAREKAVPITVIPEFQLLEIQVPRAPYFEDNTCEPAGLINPSTVPVLVAKEGFTAGKHYWEVEVGQQQDWVLGIVKQKEKQEDYWALHRSNGATFSIEGNNRPEETDINDPVIGVLLDLEEAQIYFYGAVYESSFQRIQISPVKESAEVFYPFLSKGEGRFKPVCHQNISVPLGIS